MNSSAKTRSGGVGGTVPVLSSALEPGETRRWFGYVLGEGGGKRCAMTVTDVRLLLADIKREGHWEGIEILAAAEQGVFLPRERLLTVAAMTTDGIYRRELRPIEPSSFAQIRWPAEAHSSIEKQLAKSDAMRRTGLLRRPFGRRSR